MKFFAIIVLLALAAVALALPTEVKKVEETMGDPKHVPQEKPMEVARDKRGVFVGTYGSPYVYSPYTLPVSYSVPYSYSYGYQTHPTYYSSPLVYY